MYCYNKVQCRCGWGGGGDPCTAITGCSADVGGGGRGGYPCTETVSSVGRGVGVDVHPEMMDCGMLTLRVQHRLRTNLRPRNSVI